MKHATEEGLLPITDLLDEIRREARVKERGTGIFYSRGKAFLHFHEDPRGIFADIRGPDDWERFAVSDQPGQASLLARMFALLPNSAKGWVIVIDHFNLPVADLRPARSAHGPGRWERRKNFTNPLARRGPEVR
jgi:hypothetical protein